MKIDIIQNLNEDEGNEKVEIVLNQRYFIVDLFDADYKSMSAYASVENNPKNSCALQARDNILFFERLTTHHCESGNSIIQLRDARGYIETRCAYVAVMIID